MHDRGRRLEPAESTVRMEYAYDKELGYHGSCVGHTVPTSYTNRDIYSVAIEDNIKRTTQVLTVLMKLRGSKSGRTTESHGRTTTTQRGGGFFRIIMLHMLCLLSVCYAHLLTAHDD